MLKPHTFDWSELDRESLFTFMHSIRRDVVNKSLRINKFQNIIIKHVKNLLPIRSCKTIDDKINVKQVFVGGAYYNDYDKRKLKSIELCLGYNTLDRYIKLNHNQFIKFCRNFADTILHETIHMRQFRKRRFKLIPLYNSTAERSEQRREQSYLGDPDEIGAYSFNIACELHDKFNGNTKKIVGYLNESRKSNLRGYNLWHVYLKAFEYNHNHTIIKRIKKRVMYYISRNQTNKPFQSNDWISGQSK
jgi:hypothetical protein